MLKKRPVGGIIISVVLGLILAGSIAGLVFMISQPVVDVDENGFDSLPKVSLETEVPTAEDMVTQTEFSVGE